MNYYIIEIKFSYFSSKRFRNRNEAYKYAEEHEAFALWYNGDEDIQYRNNHKEWKRITW